MTKDNGRHDTTAGNSRVEPVMPRTRFQGSKRKIAGWIGGHLRRLEFDTALDAFGGTGSVSFELKRMGKSVTYNDVLKCNHLIGIALIENDGERLDERDIERAQAPAVGREYDDFIERTFDGIYFTRRENRWLDVTIQNIRSWRHRVRRAMAFYALAQSGLAKRPYNLFHRRNLYMREACVSRSFGNKVTWDRPFDEHFRAFAVEANRAVFNNGRSCRAVWGDALGVCGSFDLVYIDTPYCSERGVGVDYRHFYHFLEGATDYGRWRDEIDWSSRHRRLRPRPDPWSSSLQIGGAFERLFERFADSQLAVSYRSDGVPSIDALRRMLKRFKRSVRVHVYDRYQYALSTNKRSREVLLIGK